MGTRAVRFSKTLQLFFIIPDDTPGRSKVFAFSVSPLLKKALRYFAI